MRRAFTLLEMLVAIVVLLAVIIATSKIFSIASEVSSAGEATADVTQQGSVLREQMERDLSRISRDGFFAIQCVAVRNDVRRVLANDPAAPLLVPDPPLNLSPTELQQLLAAANGDEGQAYAIARARYIVRCDQLVFFTNGNEQSARWAGPGDLATAGGGQRSKAARIYYGHGVQFPQLTNDPANFGESPTSPGRNIKPVIGGITGTNLGANARQVVPWTYAPGSYLTLAWNTGPVTNAPRIPATQPEAREWVLARRAVLLADDGGSPWYYPELKLAKTTWPAAEPGPDPSSAPSIFGDRRQVATNSYPMELRNRDWAPISGNIVPSPMIQSGWVDIASSDLDSVRRFIAPTLPLAAPFEVWSPSQSTPGADDGSWSIPSVVPPWTGFRTGQDPGPLGWPAGSALPFPTGAALLASPLPNLGDSASNQPGAVGAYSTQRDRILRGCFGTPADGSAPSAVGAAGGFYSGLLGWPRAERSVANLNRRTEIALSPVILSNCSSFRVDWTWSPNVGRSLSPTGEFLGVTDRPIIQNDADGSGADISGNFVATMSGFQPWVTVPSSGPGDPGNQPVGSIPWFGFPDTGTTDGVIDPVESQQLGATLAQTRIGAAIPTGTAQSSAPNVHMEVVARAVEGFESPQAGQHPAITAPFGVNVPVRVYSAVFGFNSTEPAAQLQGDLFTAYLAKFDGRNPANGQLQGPFDGALSRNEWVYVPSSDTQAERNIDGITAGEFAQLDTDGDDVVTRVEYDGRRAVRVLRDDFTPWPSQLRVTAVIHDPRLRLGKGREVQFVLEVPNRGSK